MRTLPITRTDGIAVKVQVANADELVSALNLLDGVDSLTQLRDLNKARYGTHIIRTKDEEGNDVLKSVQGKTAGAFDLERYEAIWTGAFRKLIKAKASNFTSRDQSWTISLPGEEEEQAKPAPDPAPVVKPADADADTDPLAPPVVPVPTPVEDVADEPSDEKSEALLAAESAFDDYWRAGKAAMSLIRVDRLSVALKVAYLRLVWRGGRVVWEPVYPQDVFLGFPEQVIETGETGEHRRCAVTTELEDACAVVIRVAETRTATEEDEDATGNESTFMAYLGRSETEPNGRHLVFTGLHWYEIPERGNKCIVEEYESGNPLTVFGNENPEFEAIEYPIVPFFGTDAGAADSLLPTQSLDLPQSMIEIESTIGRCLTALSDAARGKDVYTRDGNASNLDAPWGQLSTTQAFLLAGQSCTHMTLGAGEAKIALDGTLDILRTIAENHDVPGYQVTPDKGIAPESGISLAIQTRPQLDDRDERAGQTAYSVERMWQIMKALIWRYAPADQRIPLDAELSWDPGTIDIPESETDRTTNIKAALDAGFIDKIEAVRQWHRLPSRRAAEELLESMGNPEAAKATSAGGFGGFGMGQDL